MKFHMSKAEVEALDALVAAREEETRLQYPGRIPVVDLTDVRSECLDFARLARSNDYRQATYRKCEALKLEANSLDEDATKYRTRVEDITVERSQAEAEGRPAPRRKVEPRQLERDAKAAEKKAVSLREQAAALWADLPD